MPMKNEIRKLNKLLRKEMPKQDVKSKSRKASDVFLVSDIYKECKILMMYMPLGNETDTSIIMKTALSDNKKIVLPVTDGETGEITTYYADSDTEFQIGAYCIREPENSKEARLEDIDVIVVPGIAFDMTGARVGFGKGCYDRLLKNTNAIKVGYCYDFQVSKTIPKEDHDILMDYIVTNNGMIKCGENL